MTAGARWVGAVGAAKILEVLFGLYFMPKVCNLLNVQMFGLSDSDRDSCDSIARGALRGLHRRVLP